MLKHLCKSQWLAFGSVTKVQDFWCQDFLEAHVDILHPWKKAGLNQEQQCSQYLLTVSGLLFCREISLESHDIFRNMITRSSSWINKTMFNTLYNECMNDASVIDFPWNSSIGLARCVVNNTEVSQWSGEDVSARWWNVMNYLKKGCW